jgi:hypothetical protein
MPFQHTTISGASGHNLLLIFSGKIFVIDNPCGIAKRANVFFLLHNCDVFSFPTPGSFDYFIAKFGVFVVINVTPIYFYFSQFST